MESILLFALNGGWGILHPVKWERVAVLARQSWCSYTAHPGWSQCMANCLTSTWRSPLLAISAAAIGFQVLPMHVGS
ncbi:hypothetical protein ASPBRDRAFT_568421 [Aspergillus brasiliensis CBS 101740]|uniref:Uncharacterized protein n=1 Tax=Aspergillus brasiliensis (strain CBS 101740 / IMI 381727 / IBT 21946) TaxID=767769 RepID=A0A1L9UIR2_ASPBC|nr:hypothetical protein ASPBRDRAFT_568421 [Aspergillus brasiliensis CBS 101740]